MPGRSSRARRLEVAATIAQSPAPTQISPRRQAWRWWLRVSNHRKTNPQPSDALGGNPL